MPICNICALEFPESLFAAAGRPPKNRPATLQASCYTCRRRETEYRAKAKRQNTPKPALREVILRRYGAKCICCGESNLKFLTIEHTLNNGASERRKWTTEQICRHIVNQNFPPDYAVMCMNCNWAKGRYGICPHKEGEHAL